MSEIEPVNQGLPGYTPYSIEAIKASLQTMILGSRIELHQQVGSTNDLVREAGRRGEKEGLIVIAEEQVAGRGRMGRRWVAPPGCCVLCSVLLRPRFSPQYAFYLTIAVALAIQRACATILSTQHRTVSPRIKWPNDVLINGRKVSGVLSESEFVGGDWGFAVVGFGINANLGIEQLGDLRSTATSLSIESGQPVSRTSLLVGVLSELEALYLLLQNGQFAAVHEQWVAALETLGKQVTITEGGSTWIGQALRVADDGALILRVPGGAERRVIAGDVSLR